MCSQARLAGFFNGKFNQSPLKLSYRENAGLLGEQQYFIANNCFRIK
ncbi:hypothetical protein PALI_a1869 [Pseudoalteromonas aliena SW19]|uniref:Uncharacterized protein n=1 Tax=Pseudoalteromonas aliena SW19 TaxID=1314866 RepID=A0ABR9DW55_9GAMM|nr:hypothetical protein [Pseudoalteromonas aliena SW19]